MYLEDSLRHARSGTREVMKDLCVGRVRYIAYEDDDDEESSPSEINLRDKFDTSKTTDVAQS